MKRLFLAALLASAFCGPVLAQDTVEQDRFYVEPSTIKINSWTHTGTIEVWLDNVTSNYNTYQMDLYLPDGFSIAKNSAGNFEVTPNNGTEDSNKTTNHTVTVVDRGTFYRMLAYSPTLTPVKTGAGVLFTVTIEAPESFSSETDAEGYLKNINIAEGSTSHYFDDISFPITLEVVTGIDASELDCVDGPKDVYNLQGVCLKRKATKEEINSLSPGIYIIGDRKVVVK